MNKTKTDYLKEILDDKQKKLANLECDLAVFETLDDQVFLGEVPDENGGKKKLTLNFAKEHITRQIEEVKRAIEVNIKLIKDAKKTK